MEGRWRKLSDEQPEELERVLFYFAPEEGEGYYELGWLHSDSRILRTGGFIAARPPYAGWWWTELPAPPAGETP